MLEQIRTLKRSLQKLIFQVDVITSKLEQRGAPYTCDDIADRYLLAGRGGLFVTIGRNMPGVGC